jgi:tetratricopeptide (TPR) repeat protein
MIARPDSTTRRHRSTARRRRPGAVAAPSAALLLAVLLAGTSHADGGSRPAMPSSPTTQPPPNVPLSPEEQAALNRKKAEDIYASAWREVEKAKDEQREAQDLRGDADPKAGKKADDREASAQKRLLKARDRFQEAVTLAPDYADAWNMLGFTRRKTGDVDGAFKAYWECLRINPEHHGAHEYMGEGYLMRGQLELAQAELAWLQKRGASKEAAELANAIDAWVKANPEAAAKKPAFQDNVPQPHEPIVPADTTR